MMPDIREAVMVAAGRASPSPSLMERLGTTDFQRACRVASVPMHRLASIIMPSCQAQAMALLETWEGMLIEDRCAATAPPCHLDDKALQHLHVTLRRLSGADLPNASYTEFGEPSLGSHRTNGTHESSAGTCGLFAATLNFTLFGQDNDKVGGHYVILANGNFSPEKARGCHHVALRLGNWILDGNGVSRISPFMKKWMFDDFAGVHAIHEPGYGCLIGHMQTNEHAVRMLDAEGLHHDLVQAGIGDLHEHSRSQRDVSTTSHGM